MKKKKSVKRAWTPSDVRELKSLARKKVGVTKISKALKRTIGATAVKAHVLGVSLDTRGWIRRRSSAYNMILSKKQPSVSIIAQFLDRSPLLLQDFAISRLYCATRVGCTGSGFAFGLKQTRNVFALRVFFTSEHPAR